MLRLQPLTRSRLVGLGEVGKRWHEELPGLLTELETRWGLTVERSGLPGGSASWVGRARTADGAARVIKVGIPGHDLSAEAELLRRGDGRGLARLHAHDPSRNAVLLEALGPSLATSSVPVAEQLDHLAAACRQIWTISSEGYPAPAPGQDKASSLARLVRDTDARLGHPCPRPVLELALRYAERRADAYDPARCVLVHGDPHPANALRDDAAGPSGLRYRFVDPDGFLADPAYDLGVVLREWNGSLGDRPRERLAGWCERLADQTGLSAVAIWEWAYLERVSTGLHVLDFGAQTLGRRFLDTASELVPDSGRF